MDNKEAENITSRMSILQQRIAKADTEVQKSGPSASTYADVQNIYQELQQLAQNTTRVSHIPDELDKVFAVEEVGESCNLCQIDLARDPERLGGSLYSLQESCVLACGHVYHFKCLKETTLDLQKNRSKDPSCIFCIS